jgi:hypothetical protein
MNSQTNQLAETLNSLPAHWKLTPLGKRDEKGEINPKAPYIKDWANKDLDREFIAQSLISGKAIGIGLRLGESSGDLVAIDFDGQSAIDWWTEKFGEVPDTVSWTSGKEGRYQALFQVPESYRGRVKNKKITTGKSEQLEFRYTGHQSVLPPSPHPETDGYKWINSPNDTPVALLPQPVMDYWLELIDPPKPQTPPPNKPKPQQQVSDFIPPVPLENCLAKSNRELLDGVGQGRRNDSAYKLASDLIGTANYLDSVGVVYDGSPRELFDRFAIGCTPSLTDRESDTIWRSAEKANPEPACKPDGVDNCVKAWNKEHSPNKRRTIAKKDIVSNSPQEVKSSPRQDEESIGFQTDRDRGLMLVTVENGVWKQSADI